MADYNHSRQHKRLILCCDGTWMDSDDGFTKPSLFPYKPTGSLQIPSNVTRISRAFKRFDGNGIHQIIYYHSGVGTNNTFIDTLSGGMLGTGISENIREVYSFIAANYTPGDEIVLIGFSRGAFTARSVAGMIKDIGLLTREGMSNFYAIFKDQENFKNDSYNDIFPECPFKNKPRDAQEYRRKLERESMTRVYDPNGSKIRIQAVAVWDTVGSLGIPNIALLAKLGLPHSTKEYKFYDTNLSGSIRHAFQALALDEHRRPFSPAIWEIRDLEDSTDLRQVWFPGSHANIGGGYDDQEVANTTLAWMMDQLASIGVAFKDEAVDSMFELSVQYYESLREPTTSFGSLFCKKPIKQWSTQEVYDKHHPVRPWGLGKIYNSDTGIWLLAGKETRCPGLYHRSDPDTGIPTEVPMTHTNERIHSSVRIRLELEGLGEDDLTRYKCPALLKKGPWRLDQIRIKVKDPIPPSATWGPTAPPASEEERSNLRWVWEYDGPDHDAPIIQTILEENLGPYERKLLLLNKGRASYEKYAHKKRRKKQKRKRRSAAYEKGHMGDDILDAIGGETAVNGEWGGRREDVVSYGSMPITIRSDDDEIDEKLERRHRGLSVNSRRKRKTIEEEEEEIDEKLRRMEMGSGPSMSHGRRNKQISEEEERIEEKLRHMEMGSTPSINHERRRNKTISEEELRIEEKLRKMEMGSSTHINQRRGPQPIQDEEERIEEKIARMERGASAPRKRSHKSRDRTRERGRERDSYSSRRRSEIIEDPYIIGGGKDRVDIADDTYNRGRQDDIRVAGPAYERGGGGRMPTRASASDEIVVIEENSTDPDGRSQKERRRRSLYNRGGGGGSDREYMDGPTREHGRKYDYKEQRNHSPTPSRRGESRRERHMWAETGERSRDGSTR